MTTHPRIAVIMLAAGNGRRLGQTEPKAFVNLGGRAILSRALESAFAMAEDVQIIVTAPAAYVPLARQIATTARGYDRHSVTVIAGGETRQDSVRRALGALDPTIEVVLVHDAARPLTPTVVFDAVASEVVETGVAVVPGLPVTDTIKRIDDNGVVVETIDREELAAVQTPQGVPRAQLEHAHSTSGAHFTDDAALVASLGYPVAVVGGDMLGFKITTEWDLRQAEAVVERAPSAGMRVGTGVKVHAYDSSRPLWLGGLLWPGEPGLHGYNDGDVVVHAICDALLSAARLGDMHTVYGSDNPRYAGASGAFFLTDTVRLVRAEGLEISNVVVQLVGNRPQIGERRRESEMLLSTIVGATVSIAATSSDALGFTGRGEGMAAIATALAHARIHDDGTR